MPVRLDYETFSEKDIKKAGMFAYAYDPSTEPLCLSIKFDDSPTKLWTPQHGDIRDSFPELHYRAKHGDTFHAWNAGFEYLITNNRAGQSIGMPKLDIRQMRDSAARASSLALPRSMGECARVLRLPVQKDEEGKRVMLKLSRPRNPTKDDPSRRWTLQNAFSDFQVLYRYCINDTDTETGIDQKLGLLSEYEQAIWEMDFRINERGVPVDIPMARSIVRMRDEYIARLENECRALIGINSSQREKLLGWINNVCKLYFPLADSYGVVQMRQLPKLDKDHLALAMSALAAGKASVEPGYGPILMRVLFIRQQVSQTSLSKFESVLNAACDDGRIRGMFLYWGAGTGRWAGRVVQLQNLKKSTIGQGFPKAVQKAHKDAHGHEYDMAVELASMIGRVSVTGRAELSTIERLYDKPLDALSSLIRPVIKAPEGNEFIVADYSAVEARIIAWLSGEEWRLEVFRTHGKIYEATASRLSGIPIDEIGKDSKERQSGKVSELALGFQGGVRALIKMGAIDKYGLKYSELKPLVKAWRATSPAIQQLWADMEQAVIGAMLSGRVVESHKCRFGRQGDFFHIQLPCARKLTYVYPRVINTVRVWDADNEKFDTYNERKHPLHPHMRSRIDPETGVWETYEHPGFRPNKMEQFLFEGADSTSGAWTIQSLYGGKTTENIVQGIGASLLRGGLLRLEAAGYNPFLHVHDEGGGEVRRGAGSVEEVNALLCQPEPWALDLPLKSEGWRGPRFTK